MNNYVNKSMFTCAYVDYPLYVGTLKSKLEQYTPCKILDTKPNEYT